MDRCYLAVREALLACGRGRRSNNHEPRNGSVALLAVLRGFLLFVARAGHVISKGRDQSIMGDPKSTSAAPAVSGENAVNLMSTYLLTKLSVLMSKVWMDQGSRCTVAATFACYCARCCESSELFCRGKPSASFLFRMRVGRQWIRAESKCRRA